MKKIKTRKDTEKNNMQCIVCHANFEVWLDNLKISLEREEKMRQRLLSYCPVCTRKDEKN